MINSIRFLQYSLLGCYMFSTQAAVVNSCDHVSCKNESSIFQITATISLNDRQNRKLEDIITGVINVCFGELFLTI